MTIALLYGGRSGEHEVSLVSASSIVRNLDTEQHRVILVGIDKKGAWYRQGDEQITRIREDSSAILDIQTREDFRVSVIPGGGRKQGLAMGGIGIPCDIVFPVLHGTYGEDGTVQGLLEMADLPYVGGGVLASSLAMDKEKTKIVWQFAGLPVVPFIAVVLAEWVDASNRTGIQNDIEKRFSWPVFVKPSAAGSSVGAAKATNRTELSAAITDALCWDAKVIVEPFIPAREIECSVTGNESPVAYIPGEVIPTHEFYDYDAKYRDPDGASFAIPAQLDTAESALIQSLAVKAYRLLDLSGFARVDFFKDKRTGTIYLNEINTIPGFTPISMFPKMCEESGLAYPDLVMKLLHLGKARHDARSQLRTSRE